MFVDVSSIELFSAAIGRTSLDSACYARHIETFCGLVMKLVPSALLCLSLPLAAATSDTLPPLQPWHGQSEALVQMAGPWQTPAEQSALTQTADYATSVAFMQRLVSASPLLAMESLGKSPQGRDIWLIKASTTLNAIGKRQKPLLLVQAGIHSGEIDGKDAGLMLLRDITQGNKAALLDQVDLLFVPILSVDAHERRSEHNRMNQRGPVLQGWRNTSQNLNINRDYAKLDTPELQALLRAITQYQPDLYIDIHVTDGEDYQYDVTYGFNEPFASQSPQSATWLATRLRPQLDRGLAAQGHIPGPLVFGLDPLDFAKGINGWTAPVRFSNGYGDVRHLPTVLVENHSLKPFKQRVLGTYVLLEETLKLLAVEGRALQQARQSDEQARPATQVLQYKQAAEPSFIPFKGIAYQINQSPISKGPYVQWLGKPLNYDKLAVYWEKIPQLEVTVPKAYWIPPQYQDVIAKLALHGVQMTRSEKPLPLQLQQWTASAPVFSTKPVEGRFPIQAKFTAGWVHTTLPVGSVRVSTDQPLGSLVVALLEPSGPDSFFSWGFFATMFERTEYFEMYALLPWIDEQLQHNPQLATDFALAQAQDPSLQTDGKKRVDWFYQRSPFYDASYLKYPVLMER